MSLLRSSLLILDLETSGLPRDAWAAPTELAAVVLDVDGVEVSAFESLIAPAQGLPPEADRALEITGITREQLAVAPGPGAVLEAFWRFWHGHGRPHVTSFNVGFDRPMLDRLLPGVRFDLPWGPCLMMTAHRAMDVARVPESVCRRHPSGELKWPKLEEAAAWLDVPQQQPAHRALADVRTACEVLRRLVVRARAEAA